MICIIQVLLTEETIFIHILHTYTLLNLLLNVVNCGLICHNANLEILKDEPFENGGQHLHALNFSQFGCGIT